MADAASSSSREKILDVAEALFARHGFADVHVVRGGMTKWLDAGLPVVRQTLRAASMAGTELEEV